MIEKSIEHTTDSPFEPGDGWREVDQDEWYHASQPTLALEKGKNDEHARYWVRETPVPALPTQPYTVIRATWKPGDDGAPKETYVRTDALGEWCNVNTGVRHGPAELHAGITGFEVLASAVVSATTWAILRAGVAKEFRDRIVPWMADRHYDTSMAYAVANEFGVVDD